MSLALLLLTMFIVPDVAAADTPGAHWAATALDRFIAWGEQHRAAALVLVAAIDVLAVVLMLPAILLALCAGLLFGALAGSVLIVVSTVLGAGIAHALGHRLLRARALRWLAHHPGSARLTHALLASGWRGVLLLRLVPFFPFKTSNYLLGALRVPLRDFALGTALGILPMTVVTVSAGALADDLLATRTPQPAGAVDIALLGLALLAVTLLGWHARRALRAQDTPR